MSITEERIRAVMVASLDAIVVPGEQVRPAEHLVREWDLPDRDRFALTSWGLPADSEMRPNIQEELRPALVPNVSGARERQLISPDQRLYKLIDWSTGRTQIGAVAGTGRVLAISPKPRTARDLHPQLRSLHPEFYTPAVEFLNSSVTQLVEAAWRWRAAFGIILELQSPDPGNSASRAQAAEAFGAHVDLVKRCERIVLEHIEVTDDGVRADDRNSLWRSTVINEGYE